MATVVLLGIYIKRDYAYAALLAVLTFVLRFWYVDAFEIAIDEPFTLWHAQLQVSDILLKLKDYNNPPLFEVFLHYWTAIFGTEVWVVRLPGVIFSAFTGGIILLLGSKYFGRLSGWGAGLLFLLCTQQTTISHDVRVYPLLCLLGTASIYLFLLACEWKKNNLLWWFLLFIINTLIIYSHYFGFFILLVEALSVLLMTQHKMRSIVALAITLFLNFLCFLPHLVVLLNRFQASVSTHWVGKSNFTEFYNNLVSFFNAPVPTVIFISIAVVGGVLLVVQKRGTPFAAKVIMLWSAQYLVLFGLGFSIPMFFWKYLSFLAPAIFLLYSYIICYGFPKPVAIALLIIVVVTAGVSTKLNPDHNRRVADFAAQAKHYRSQYPNCSIVISPPWNDLNFIYHYNKQIFYSGLQKDSLLKVNNIYPSYNLQTVPPNVLADSCVLFVDINCIYTDPEKTQQQYFDAHFTKKTLLDNKQGAAMYLYLKPVEKQP